MIRVIREKETTTSDSVRTPYFVLEEDTTLLLDRNGARDAAIDQATIDAGLVPTDFSARQLSNRAWRVEAIFNSSRPSKRTLEVIGDVEVGFRYQAESELIKYAKGLPVAQGAVGTPDEAFKAGRFGDLIGLQGGQWGNGLKHTGIQVTPRVTNWVRVTVENGTVDEEYEVAVGSIMGHTNSEPYRGKEKNTMRFVSCTSTIRSDADMQIYFGFDYRPTVPSHIIPAFEIVAGVPVVSAMKVPSYPGHFLFWTYDEVYVDNTWSDGVLPVPARSEVLCKQAMFWYIEEVFDSSNFAAVLGI